jgi:hypothetical protein
MAAFDPPAKMNGDVLAQELREAGYAVEDDDLLMDAGQLVIDVGEADRDGVQQVIDDHDPPPAPSDPDDIKLAVLDPNQGLGRTAARRLISAYPDVLDAVNSRNWQLLRAGLAEAHQAGDLTDSEKQTLDDVLAAHNVPQGGAQ